ncbi:MAG: SDR family NAD(P)-dependent oxidoreductase, partial [Acidobacteria bacterium]|nr:SDR family NAD(P)-dependent oxidoreductase [Acidobacteriota bacterium]
MRLDGKVAIVTGGGSGIGQVIAERLASDGASVVIDYVGSPDGAQATARSIEKQNGKGEIFEADVTRIEDIQKLVDAAWNRYGSADILVNNAGIEIRADFWDT